MGEQKISLAAARVNAKMTQSMVAEKMHVSKQTIVNREKGKIVLNLWAYQELWNRYCSIQNHAMLWICQQTATCQTSYIQQTQTKPESISLLKSLENRGLQNRPQNKSPDKIMEIRHLRNCAGREPQNCD